MDRPEYSEAEPYNEISITAEKDYNTKREILFFALRIALTVVIETAVALLFGYIAKKQLLLIVGVNAVTQLILNIMLNTVCLNSGYSEYIVTYILLELAVFVTEAVIYSAFLNKLSDKPKKRGIAVIYALVANACSFAAGLALSKIIPTVF